MSRVELHAKARTLVVEDRVQIETVTFHDDGRIDEVVGFVKGDSGKTWMVVIEGDEVYCNCPYGQAKANAAGHSHDLAVELAAKGYRSTKRQEERT